jgi:hypothetical protein
MKAYLSKFLSRLWDLSFLLCSSTINWFLKFDTQVGSAIPEDKTLVGILRYEIVIRLVMVFHAQVQNCLPGYVTALFHFGAWLGMDSRLAPITQAQEGETHVPIERDKKT